MVSRDKPNVYVSYSRAEEEDTGLIASVQNSLPDVRFRLDTEDVQYRTNFEEFIQQIGEARYLFVVLSQKYLESFYCMYELLSIYKNDDLDGSIALNDRLFFVREDGLNLADEPKKSQLRSYWQTVLEHRQQGIDGGEGFTRHGSLQEVSELNCELENLLNAFQRIHSPDHTELLSYQLLQQSTFEPVRAWLGDVLPEWLPYREYGSAKDYIKQLEDSITEKLSVHEDLLKRLARRLECDPDEEAVAAEFVNCKDYAKLLNTTIRLACISALKQASPEDYPILREDLWEIISWLKGIAVQKENQKDIRNKRSRTHANIKEIKSKTPMGQFAEIDYLTNTPTRISNIIDNNPVSEDRIAPIRGGTWDSVGVKAANDFVLFVYSNVMLASGNEHDVSRKEPLSYDERSDLNARICGDAERLLGNFHALLKIDELKEFMHDPEFLSQMQILLPAFDFYLQVDHFDSERLFKSGERRFSDAFTNFFETVLQDT